MSSFWSWWQTIPSKLSPYILQTEYFSLHYYGLMYVLAFAVIFSLIYYRNKTEDFSYNTETLLDLLIWSILGVVIGGRLGYTIFYNPSYYLTNPLQIFLPISFNGGIELTGIRGMSYHGGLIGVILASWIFCKKKNIDFWKIADFVVPTIPIGYMFGRIGNFINGELFGRITDKAWGMYFQADTKHLRHPSQLYEAFFEGVFLFIILWTIRKKDKFDGFLLSVYIIGYGIVRFIIEFFRMPDPQLGFIFGFLTMGQFLSILMIIGGGFLYWHRKNKTMIK